jgi:hypothetical protein
MGIENISNEKNAIEQKKDGILKMIKDKGISLYDFVKENKGKVLLGLLFTSAFTAAAVDASKNSPEGGDYTKIKTFHDLIETDAKLDSLNASNPGRTMESSNPSMNAERDRLQKEMEEKDAQFKNVNSNEKIGE